MQLIDSHAHLDQISCLPDAIKRAEDLDVKAIVAVSTDIESCRKTFTIGEKFKNVYPALGIHPNNINNSNTDEAVRFIEYNLDGIVAIGEIGLDYARAQSKQVRKKQKEVYIRFLKIAKENDLPVSIHSRDAYRDAYDLMKKFGPERGVFHWYDGPEKTQKEIVSDGYYLSTTPALAYSEKHRRAIKSAPLDQILVETDSPVYIRTLKRNAKPADVLYTAEMLAELKDEDLDDIARISTINSETLFQV